jgi:hypothetical protein
MEMIALSGSRRIDEMNTTITKEQLDELWNAIEYTRGTISHFPERSAEKPDWVLVHHGRASQSRAFLNKAIEIVNQLKREMT